MKLSSPYTHRTSYQGRLIQEIGEGLLKLINNGVCPVRFAFCTEDGPIGLFSLESTEPFALRALRAWSVARETWDPFTQMWRPTSPVPQFNLLRPNTPLFLVELADIDDKPVDKVAFTCSRIEVSEAVVTGFENLRFEQAALLGVHILG